MTNNSKLELKAGLASRRFGKDTLCHILKGSDIINFISRNSLLPPGFMITDKDHGYSSITNRVLVIPSVDVPEFLSIYSASGGSAPLKPNDGSDAPGMETKDKDAFQIQKKLNAKAALLEFLKQTMIVVYLNPRLVLQVTITDLDNYDVLIDSVDVMGSVSGTLVPKPYKKDTNRLRTWNGK